MAIKYYLKASMYANREVFVNVINFIDRFRLKIFFKTNHVLVIDDEEMSALNIIHENIRKH